MSEATGLMLAAVAADGLDGARRERLVGTALDELVDIAGGPRAMREAESRLREAVSSSSQPQLQRGRNGADLEEAVLSSKARKSLKRSDFAIPERRAYPIHDRSHAANALARVSQHGSAEEKARVRAAVRRRYPNMGRW